MDRRELEIMLNEAFDRGIVTAKLIEYDDADPYRPLSPVVTVGILDDLGRESGMMLSWLPLPVSGNDIQFAGSCKALGGRVPQNTYREELVSAIAEGLMDEAAVPALDALETALDGARREGYCVFDRGIHGDVPAPGMVYLCSTYSAAVSLKDSLDSVRAQGNEPDTHTLGAYRMVDGYCIMGGLAGGSLADDEYAVDGALIEDWGVGDAAFRISDLKAKTFSYAVDAGDAQGASTLVYYTDEGADPVLFQQAADGERLASDNFLAENSIIEDLERAYTGDISPVYLNRDIVDMAAMAEAYGWGRLERTPAAVAAGAQKAAKASAAGKSSPGKVADRAREVSKDSAPRH